MIFRWIRDFGGKTPQLLVRNPKAQVEIREIRSMGLLMLKRISMEAVLSSHACFS